MINIILNALKKRSIPIVEKESYYNIVGVRTHGGEFNDSIVIFGKVNGEWDVVEFKATTEPGQGWLNKKMGSSNGTFILKPGYYPKCWVFGKHKNKYEALVQNYKVDVFSGWRDSNKNGKVDIHNFKLFKDVVGMNLHSTKYGYLKDYIGDFSAGCQVILDWRKYHTEFIPRMKAHSMMYGTFDYVLLNKYDLD